jgi:protein-disulfide isomerase
MIRSLLSRGAPLAAAGVLALSLAGPAQALDPAAMSDEERAAFRAEIRAYLLENPEVIMEAVAVLEQRQQEEAARADVGLIQAHAAEIFDDGYSHVGGNPDGDVTIVEFIDYRCGFCRRAHTDVQELIASDGNIRLITKEFPILGPNSLASSKFAIAVKQIAGGEAYEAANDALIQLNAEMTPPAMRRLAETIGVDGDAVLDAMETDAVRQEIMQTRALAEQLNITGTPTFVVGPEMLRGYVPLEGMREVVEAVREAG